MIEKNFEEKQIKIKSFQNYKSLMKLNKIFFNHKEREEMVITKFDQISKKNNYKLSVNPKLIEEVLNIVDNPNILLINFNKEYLRLPKEIIVSTLEVHQKYFPLFDKKTNDLTNFFLVVSNKPDNKNLIKLGNKRVVEARLADAKFFGIKINQEILLSR